MSTPRPRPDAYVVTKEPVVIAPVALGPRTALYAFASLAAAMRPLSPQQKHGVSVRIADQQSRPIIPERHGSGRDEADTRCCKLVLQGRHIVDLDGQPRRRNVVAAQRRRRASRGAGRSIAEQFEMRWIFRP